MAEITWARQYAGMTLPPEVEGQKPTLTLDDIGIEMHTGEPVYDNGRFFVIDTVLDLQWAVCWWDLHGPLRKTTDKYEAIRWADEFKEAENG